MPHAIIGAVAGLVLGLGSFIALERLVTLWLAGASPRRVLGWQALRLALTVLCFVGLARLSGVALLCGLGGYLAARTLRTRRVQR